MVFDVDAAREMDLNRGRGVSGDPDGMLWTRESYLVAVSENLLHFWPEGHRS